MKISLKWAFDHIQGYLADNTIDQLVNNFIKTTAEIEGWKKISFDVGQFTVAQVRTISADAVVVYSVEYDKKYSLFSRNDLFIDGWYLIKVIGNDASWATAIDCGGTKDMLLPALDIVESLKAGAWKNEIECEDYILDVDNKSINNRPDLWCHRGIAREIAAILGMTLKPLSDFIVTHPIIEYKKSSLVTRDFPFSIAINSDVCKKFSAGYLESIEVKPSNLSMALRLSRLDSRAINAVVDATNYVMLDIGQPMHAFDAQTFIGNDIVITHAHDKESLSLLDGSTVELTAQDLVIADGKKAISLAGVMGGSLTSITAQTTSVLLESATFEPTSIRRTAQRHKKITESSKRFEKSLDSENAVYGLLRFISILNQINVRYSLVGPIALLGETVPKAIITIPHHFIESRLGVEISSEKVISILEKLDFIVTHSLNTDEKIVYTITVPSFRATKDVKIPEDIVEEVGRYYGYDLLPRVMPSLPLRPADVCKTYCIRKIKHFLSYGLQMRELYGYSFFDESMLSLLGWQPTNFVAIKNPISENYTRMVTTLLPHLFKAVAENSIHHMQLRFYELARVWDMKDAQIQEKKSLSGIFFDRAPAGDQADKKNTEFYSGKAFLMRLFEQLSLDIRWQSCDEVAYPWCMPFQTAALMHGNKCIGFAGMVEQSVVNMLSVAGGNAFIFELDADYIIDYKKPVFQSVSLSKYPSVRRDVSVLINAGVSADQLINCIQSIDNRIESVNLIDFFTKPEWFDQKALTFHVEMCDKEKTLTADDIEVLWGSIINQLKQSGATIR